MNNTTQRLLRVRNTKDKGVKDAKIRARLDYLLRIRGNYNRFIAELELIDNVPCCDIIRKNVCN